MPRNAFFDLNLGFQSVFFTSLRKTAFLTMSN
jgi:hypothetical protein